MEEQYVRPLVQDKEKELILLDPADAAQTETLTMLRKTFDLDETAYGYELRLQAALSEIWAHLAAQAHPRPGTEEKAATAAQKKLKQMMVYVNAHYAEKITVPMLAAAAYCSERECYRTFQSCPAHKPHRLHPHRAAAIRL